MNLTRGINLRKIAEMMPGASGAEVKGVCTEAGMYALRERRVHVTQEDFEMAVAKVKLSTIPNIRVLLVFLLSGDAERCREEHVTQKTLEITLLVLTLWFHLN